MKIQRENLLVITIVGLLLLTLGVVSYSAFKFSKEGTVINKITSGKVTMTFSESDNIISITGALPTTDRTGTLSTRDGEYFDFTVSSSITGNININYEIAAEELAGNTIDGKYIKYYLTKVKNDGSEQAVFGPSIYKEETTINSNTGRPAGMMSLYTSSMNVSETTNYRLRMYVSEEYNPQGDGGNLKYQVRVNVYGLNAK